jgi:hypothetical protein
MDQEDAKRLAYLASPEGKAEDARLTATLRLTNAERDALTFPNDDDDDDA